MSEIILDDEGNEKTVYSQEEIDAQVQSTRDEYEKKLQEKDGHVADKLDQFKQAGKSAEKLHEEAMTAIAEAKSMAEEAKLSVQQAKDSELVTKRDFYIQTISGNDTDLTKRLEDAYAIINMPASNDKEIMERLQKAITLAGVSAPSATASLSFGGSSAPSASLNSEESRNAAHLAWKEEYGIKI